MTRLTTFLCFFFTLFLTATFTGGREFSGADYLRLKSEVSRFFRPVSDDGDVLERTRWAVLIAGSKKFENYRHQANVCHAYQLLKRGGLKDENIVVFMYDAYNAENPRPGIIIHNPISTQDVYRGVPKDYTGDNVTVDNFFVVILGNMTALKGGRGKVAQSGPNDHIFIYYSAHGGPGVLGMPTSPYIYAKGLNDVLKKKHDSKGYKSLVFYLEASESGSILEGLLPGDLNIYATTATNAEEKNCATYCPGDKPGPQEYPICLADLYSVAWIEDGYMHAQNHYLETLKQQYERVKERTLNRGFPCGSHVMMYGDKKLGDDKLYLYMGASPDLKGESSLRLPSRTSNQRDADLVHFWAKYHNVLEGSARKAEAQKKLLEAMSHRMHVDDSVNLIGKLLFGLDKGLEILRAVRSVGKPLVDDWGSLKSLVRTFEEHWGSLSQYGMKHMHSSANICNAGVRSEQTTAAAAEACPTFPSTPWSSLRGGFNA